MSGEKMSAHEESAENFINVFTKFIEEKGF